MEMKGVVKYFPNGEADVRAFLAGNDILELSPNSALAIKKIRKAIRKDEISMDEFNAKVKKVLAAKYWAGLNNYHPTSTTNLVADLNRQSSNDLVQQLSDAAVTVLKGDATSLQLNPFAGAAILSIGVDKPTVFQQEMCRSYPFSKIFRVDKDATVAQIAGLQQQLKQFSQVFISINDTRPRPASKLDYNANVKLLIAQLAAQKNTVICVFANAYTIAGLPGIEKAGALLVCYQMTDDLQRSAVKVITQRLKPTGKLPVSVNVFFPTGTGITLP